MLLVVCSHAGNLQRVERQMFMLLWGPTIAAVSVILDYAEDTLVVRQALDSILLCARIASYHCLDEVRLLEGDPTSQRSCVLFPAISTPAEARLPPCACLMGLHGTAQCSGLVQPGCRRWKV